MTNLITTTLLLLFMMLYFGNPIAVAQDKQPNILLIFSDDQGYHDLGAYGNKKDAGDIWLR